MLALWSPHEITFAALVPLVELVGLYCAWRALLHTRTPQGATAWVIALVLQPFIAVPLYAVFGRRKFVGYTQARRDGDDALSGIAEQVATVLAAQRSDREADVPRLAALERLAKLPFTRGNRAELLVNGKATFDSIFAGLEPRGPERSSRAIRRVSPSIPTGSKRLPLRKPKARSTKGRSRLSSTKTRAPPSRPKA